MLRMLLQFAPPVRFMRYSGVLVVMLTCSSAPVSAGVIYDNGTNGLPGLPTKGGLTMNLGIAVTDSFTVTAPSIVTGVEFWTSAFPGGTPVTVDWLITSDHFGGSTLASGTANLNYTFLFNIGGINYDVGRNSFSVPNVQLATGTYWLQLQNASVTGGQACCGDGNPPDTLYWDRSDGPSQAYQSITGAQPSESFEVLGTTTPEPSSLALLGSAAVVLLSYRRALAKKLSL